MYPGENEIQKIKAFRKEVLSCEINIYLGTEGYYYFFIFNLNIPFIYYYYFLSDIFCKLININRLPKIDV